MKINGSERVNNIYTHSKTVPFNPFIPKNFTDFKAYAKGSNIVRPNTLGLFEWHCGTYWMLLSKVKLLAQKVPTLLSLCDWQSITPTFCAGLHGTHNNVGLSHTHRNDVIVIKRSLNVEDR